MQKPEVRVIEYQENSKPQEINLSSSEAYALMAKYGLSKQNIPEPQLIHNDPNKDLTFYELIALEETKIKSERQQKEIDRLRELNKPTPHSFDRNKVQYYDNNYRGIEDSGFGLEVKIVSDMPINNQYYK